MYEILDGVLNILIVDDEEVSRDFVGELLSPIKLFNIYKVSKASEAIALYRTVNRFHVCICDLGINDIANDEFYLLRNYSNKSSFIILTGSTSPSKGAKCIELGAREVFEKKVPFEVKKFVAAVNKLALINVVNPFYKENNADTISTATKILFEKKPQSVTEWADMLRISDRQLRNLFQSKNGSAAKYIIYLFHLFSQALEFYESRVFTSESSVKISEKIVPQEAFEYFSTHKRILTAFIN